MKKVNKKLASAIVLGLMMSVPFSASAADVETVDTDGGMYINSSDKHFDGSVEFINSEAVNQKWGQIAFAGSTTSVANISSDGDILLNGIWNNAFYVSGGGTINIEANNFKTINTDYYGYQVFHAWNGKIDVDIANDIDIKNVYTAVYAQRVDGVLDDSVVNINADGNINFESDAGIVAANHNDEGNTTNCVTVDVKGKNVSVKGTNGYAIVSMNRHLYQDEDKNWIIEYNDDYAGKTSVSVKADENLHVEGTSGAIFAKNGKNENDAKVVLEAKNITVNGDIIADTNAYVSIGNNENFEKADITGDITATNNSIVDINLGNGILEGEVTSDDGSDVSLDMNNAVWNVTGNSRVRSIDGVGTIKIADESVESVKVDEVANGSNLTIGNTSNITDKFDGNDIAGSIADYAGKFEIAGGNDWTYVADSGSVIGETTAVIDKDGNVISVVEEANEYNAGISEMASIALMAWRAENNDMNKRLGELRNSNGEHGVWARMMRGESEFGSQSIKNQYNTYQLGYDEKLSTDEHWTVGAAISYTDAQSSFATGSGENNSTGFAMYGSYLGDNGTFVDLIAKYARLDNEFDVYGGAGSGDYSTNGYSVSAEYGKRTQLANDFYFEPQVELTYGKVADVDYMTSNGVKVSQDATDSLVGRVGFAAGKNIKNGNVYVRASYLYDFDGETSVTFTNNTSRTFEEDLGGGWFEFGIGTNINLSDATYLYFDVEKTTGGEVDTNWQWNAGVRYSF